MICPPAAIRRAVETDTGAVIPSIVANPVSFTRSSWSIRTTTVAPCSGRSVCGQPSACSQSRTSASACICTTDRRGTSGSAVPSRCGIACGSHLVGDEASMAVLSGAPCSGVRRPVNSNMPSTSRMLSCSSPRFSPSRGATPSGSSHASARARTRFSWSMVSPGACSTRVRLGHIESLGSSAECDPVEKGDDRPRRPLRQRRSSQRRGDMRVPSRRLLAGQQLSRARSPRRPSPAVPRRRCWCPPVAAISAVGLR